MIKLVENFKEYNLEDFKNNVFFGRILSDFNTLSVFEESMFYVCLNNEDVAGVVSKIDGNITLALTEKSPLEEIKEFLNAIGYSTILCDNAYSHVFDGEKTCGSILKIISNENINCKAKELYSENLKDVFDLIQEAFGLQLDFVKWCADLSHKMRHAGARLFGIYEGDVLVSCAFSLFETEFSAVMSSVSTRKEYRGKGYADEVVKKVLSENIAKSVYAFTENKNVEDWYQKLGFTKESLWSEIENVL